MPLKPVDTAIKVLIGPLIDDTDFKSREEAIAYDAGGMEIDVVVEKADGTVATTAVTPTTAGDYDWTHTDQGWYELELPASGGASFNNTEEGVLRVVGHCTGVLPFSSAAYDIVPTQVYDSLVKGTDNLEVDQVQLGGSTQSSTDLKDFADAGYDPATNKVQGVVLVDTCTTNTDMVGTDGAALASVCTEARLAELGAANVPSDVDTLIARLTAARSGYLDNLNVGGLVASSAEATAIQNNTRAVRVVPTVFERPDSGDPAIDFRIEVLLYDATGNMEVPDSAPTIGVVNQAGTSRDANLDATTMSLISTGRYRSTYTISDAHELEQLLFVFVVTENTVPRTYGNSGLVVDTTAVDFTAADRTKLEAVHGGLGGSGNIAEPGDEMGLANDAITAAKFDQSTAHPLGAADSGANQVARVGADGDTLQALSDQLDGVATDAARLTAARAEVLTDWIDAGRLDLLLDACYAGTPPTANEVADALLKRDVDQVEDTAPRHSLTTVVLQQTAAANTSANQGFLTVFRTDGQTEHCQIAISTDASADPIDGIG